MEYVLGAIQNVFLPINLFAVFVGTFAGIVIGALPGLSTVMGLSILLPFTLSFSGMGGMYMLLGVFCGGKLEAEAISESIALAENTFVTADGTTYLLDQFLCEHMYAAENGRILCVDTTSCSVTGEPLYRKLEQDGEPCGTLLPEAFHAQNLLGTLASVQHKLTTAQQVQLALRLLDWKAHEYFDPDRVLLFHGTGTPEVTFAAAKGDTAISSDFIIPWAAFTGTSLDHVQDPVEAIVDDAGKVPSSLLEDAAIVYHSVLYPNTSTGLEHVDSAMLTRRTLERLACIYPCV